MAEYTVVFINTSSKNVRVLPLITYDYTIPDSYSSYIRADSLLDIYNYDVRYYQYLRVFKDNDPEMDKYVNKLKLIKLMDN